MTDNTNQVYLTKTAREQVTRF